MKRILIIGDVMLDTYYDGKVTRISPEAPVPVFKKETVRSVLGGAANVASNISVADHNVSIMSVIGKDDAATRFLTLCKEKQIDTTLVFQSNRKTTEKTRFLANGHQQVLRLDDEDTYDISTSEVDALLNKLRQQITSFDMIILSDYMKGLLTNDFTQGVIACAKEFKVPVIVDVKDPNAKKYSGAMLLKPNKKELHDLTGLPVDSDEQVITAAEELKNITNCTYVLATRGARGMILVGDGEPYCIHSVAKEVFDVTGAGDTTIAYLAACLVNGYSIRDAVDVANIAAGIQVSKVGTSAVSWDEVKRSIAIQTQSINNKVLTFDQLDDLKCTLQNKKVVFTNGCFDILHIGHTRYLQQAKALGDVLIVGLNSDASVRRLKGESRPINSENDRAEMLSALDCVDYVVIFEEDTPYNLIEKIQPDILVKGGDYKPEDVVGKDIVEKHGGRVEILPFVDGKSTTSVINKIVGGKQ